MLRPWPGPAEAELGFSAGAGRGGGPASAMQRSGPALSTPTQPQLSLPSRARDAAGARGYGRPYPMCSESLHEVSIGCGVAIGSAGACVHAAQLPQKTSQSARRRPERRHFPVVGPGALYLLHPQAQSLNGTVAPTLLLSSLAKLRNGSLPFSAKPS